MELNPSQRFDNARARLEEWESVINGIIEFSSLEVEKLRRNTYKWKLVSCIVLVLLFGLISIFVGKDHRMVRHVTIFLTLCFCILSILYYLDFEHIKVNIPHWEGVFLKGRYTQTTLTTILNMLSQNSTENEFYLIFHILNHELPVVWAQHYKIFDNNDFITYLLKKLPDDEENTLLKNYVSTDVSICICQ